MTIFILLIAYYALQLTQHERHKSYFFLSHSVVTITMRDSR